MRTLIMGMSPPQEGGSERHVYEISSRIPETKVLTQKDSICKNKIELTILQGPQIIKNLSFFISSFLYSIYLLLRPEREYDIIHIHENLLYFLAPLLRLRYKVIITVHGITGFKFYDNKFLWFFFGNALRFANTIISVSIADKELLDKGFGNVIYIPNGVDLDVYKRIKKPKVAKEICFVGRIHEQKGVEHLIRSFLAISEEFPSYNLKIIGKKEGRLYESLSQKYKSNKIEWKGFISKREELFSEIASAEILVFPSIWEALPWPALLEGLGSSRPVIASDLKGMRKVFKDKSDIILVKPGSSEELYRAINLLISNKNLAKKLGNAGSKKAKEFTWDSTAQKVRNLYNR